MSTSTIVELKRKPHPSPEICRVAFAPDSQSLATASRRIGATVFEGVNNRARRYPHWGSSVAFSPDGRFLAMDDMFQIALWDVKRDRIHCVLKTKTLTLGNGFASGTGLAGVLGGQQVSGSGERVAVPALLEEIRTIRLGLGRSRANRKCPCRHWCARTTSHKRPRSF